jgi:phosphoglycerate dehydrogenase-like enzyme
MVQLHFETRRTRKPVFQFTRELIDAAATRAKAPAETRLTLGYDLEDIDTLAGAAGLVTSSDIIRDPRFPLADLAKGLPKLRWIHIIGAGIERLLPLDWLPRGVSLTNNSGVHMRKTGEFAAMALLMLNSRLPRMIGNQRAAHWDSIFTPSIAGATVTIVGLGDMGAAAAREAKRMGMRVIGVRRSARPHRLADEMVGVDQLGAAVARADCIYVSAPLTADTTNLVSRAILTRAKPGAGLVNIGRAGVVDYAALRDALVSGALSGAVLDVFDPEPLPADSPLWSTPNLVIMPHCSSDDRDQYIPLTFDLAFANLARLMAGKQLKNRVDPKRGY